MTGIHNSLFNTGCKHVFFMCSNAIIALNAMNVCCSSWCMKMEIFNRLWKGLFIEQLYKNSCRWSWLDRCLLSWLLGLNRCFIKEDYNIVLARQSIWTVRSTVVWNVSVWIWSVWTHLAKHNYTHITLVRSHSAQGKEEHVYSLHLLSCSQNKCRLQCSSWAKYKQTNRHILYFRKHRRILLYQTSSHYWKHLFLYWLVDMWCEWGLIAYQTCANCS